MTACVYTAAEKRLPPSSVHILHDLVHYAGRGREIRHARGEEEKDVQHARFSSSRLFLHLARRGERERRGEPNRRARRFISPHCVLRVESDVIYSLGGLPLTKMHFLGKRGKQRDT